ncbi:MAG: hypothetical protein IKJ59_02645 [Clostridia bacterium]|nr:hypothetical protein [Clostridia bacterium]
MRTTLKNIPTAFSAKVCRNYKKITKAIPDNDKMNGIVSVGTTYGIIADSDNIEGAWDFMKYYFFSEDAFNNGAEYHAINMYKFCGIEKCRSFIIINQI